MADVQTPNGVEFSIAAKLLVSCGRVLPQGGSLHPYRAPTGELISSKTLVEGLVNTTLWWLSANGWVTLGQGQHKYLIGSQPCVMVKANYSGAPGFAGELLEVTGWVEADLSDMAAKLVGGRTADTITPIIRRVEREFDRAGIHGHGGWNAEWLDYLAGSYAPEAYRAYNTARAQPWFETARRNVVAGIGSQHYDPDRRD